RGLALTTSVRRAPWSVMRTLTSTIFFFFHAEVGIRDLTVTGVQTCALPIYAPAQRALVVALQAALAGMGERGAGFAELGEVGFVDPADVADHVREQRAVGIAAAQV